MNLSVCDRSAHWEGRAGRSKVDSNACLALLFDQCACWGMLLGSFRCIRLAILGQFGGFGYHVYMFFPFVGLVEIFEIWGIGQGSPKIEDIRI